ncbi:hypothetical protein GBA52_008868 [Prunus armeniaca]|nr:hypothetical protein GBA52_008868 [Prunus armeniaca]
MGETTRLQGTNKLFDDVVMSTVSATVNIRTIQTEIAESLDMKLVEESESIRAQRLHERIKQSKRILIILDDVWSAVKLQDVGIPFGDHEGCKILLTSRNEEVCKTMGCKDNIFRVQALNKEEAWELFKATVGESLDNNNPHLLHVAKMIADECKGLPIAIITIGKTLVSIDKNEWDTIRDQLKNSLPEIIPGMEHSVYSCIKLSYDKLDSDEKVDLSKAYNRLNWKFIEKVLGEIGMPSNFIKLVMSHVSSVRYQVCVNGKLSL